MMPDGNVLTNTVFKMLLSISLLLQHKPKRFLNALCTNQRLEFIRRNQICYSLPFQLWQDLSTSRNCCILRVLEHKLKETRMQFGEARAITLQIELN